MRKSQFGRGFASCLMQFTYHEPRLSVPRWNDSQMAVDLWFDGAKDHLADMVRPRRGIKSSEWIEAQAIALRVRSAAFPGLYGKAPHGSVAEARNLCALARSLVNTIAAREGMMPPATLHAAMVLDQKLGLKPVRGDWVCEVPMEVKELARHDTTAV